MTSHVIHFVLLGVEVPARVTSQTISEESALVFSNPSANYIKIYKKNMYVCIYAHRYIRTYVHMYMYVCNVHTHNTYIHHTLIHCMYVCMYICMYVHMYVGMYVYMYIHTHMYLCMLYIFYQSIIRRIPHHTMTRST